MIQVTHGAMGNPRADKSQVYLQIHIIEDIVLKVNLPLTLIYVYSNLKIYCNN